MNHDRLKSLSVFAQIVREGSFRGAARKLGITPSATGYHIKALEEELGAALLYRSTRKIALTEAGEQLFRAALAMIDSAESGFHAARQTEANLSGRLKITLTSALAHSHLSEALVAFHKDNPRVQLELFYTDQMEDLIGERIDLALRSGQMEDSNLKCKLIWQMPRMLVGAPDLLAKFASIASPADLGAIPWIKFAKMDTKRRFKSGNGQEMVVLQAGHLTVNSIEAMVDFTLLGAALSSPPSHFITDALASGRLRHVLPDWELDSLPVYAVWPSAGVDNPVTRRLVSYLSRDRKQTPRPIPI